MLAALQESTIRRDKGRSIWHWKLLKVPCHKPENTRCVFLPENIMIFFKMLTLVFILKYFQGYYSKLQNFSKLWKPKVMMSVTVPSPHPKGEDL
jgi:hypothetical protein